MSVLANLKEKVRGLATNLASVTIPSDGILTPDEIQTLIAELVGRAVKSFGKLADGVSFNDLLVIRDEFIPVVMQVIGALNLPGADKKAWVLLAVGMLFDSLVPKLALLTFTGGWAWLGWLIAILLRPAILPIIRSTFLSGASAAIEAIYNADFRRYEPAAE